MLLFCNSETLFINTGQNKDCHTNILEYRLFPHGTCQAEILLEQWVE